MATMDGEHMTKDKALDLALEALEQGLDEHWMKTNPLGYDAITAIKQARALDKKAENARELGLDYEPVTTLFGSLPVYDTPPVREDWGPGPHEYHSLTAAPVVPDVMTTAEGEHPEYVQGWNDCRQLMLQTRKST